MTPQDAILIVAGLQQSLAMARGSFDPPNARVFEVLALVEAALVEARERLRYIERTTK